VRIAIIPARGGSKRLPRKNIVQITGKPILTYPVKAALDSELFNEVIVSSEDEKILEIARQVGARAILRPRELAQDHSTVVEVCLHIIDEFARQKKMVSEFCCIYATALFLTVTDLRDSFRLLTSPPPSDFVMGVSHYDLHPVQALKRKGEYLTSMWPEYKGLQSQFYPDLVASNGTLYWARVEAFRKTRSFYGDRLKGYEIPRGRAVDIDTPEDLELARQLAEQVLCGLK
jgi:pseudaminic acid cytidylyltransferase